MLQVSLSGLADIWNYPSSDKNTADPLVLGGVPDDHGQAWRVCTTAAASIRADLLRDRMDDAAQAPPSNGEQREGTFAR